MAEISATKQPPRKRGPGRPFPKGVSPNPGGKPKKLVEIERMLDAEHRTVENMKEVFAQLKAMATEAVVTRHIDEKGNITESNRQPNPAFMALYLERTLGPVKDITVDLSDAPEEVLRWAAEHLAVN